ncbi:hypothetical protein ACF0H5_014108 [Mactra antiquata]
MCIIVEVVIIFACISLVEGSGYMEIGNLPADVSVFEEDTGSTYLHTFTLFESSSVGTVSCVFNPANADFTITADGGGGQYHVSTAASPSLAAGIVTLTVECDDNTVATAVSGTITVNVTANTPPVYNTGLEFGTVDVSAKTGKSGHVILTIDYTDSDTASPLPHQTILSTTPAPVTTLFQIQSDHLSLVTDMLAYDDEPTYVIQIEIGDEKTTSTGTVTVNIIDRNTPPEFALGTNQSVTLTLPEHTRGRLAIYDIDTYDAEGDAIKLTDIYNDPNIGAFDMVESTGEIFLIGGEVLDYENINQYIIQVTIEDYIDVQTTSTFSVTINVADINEQPTYSATPTAAVINESAAGLFVGVLDQQCTDPDNDTITYSILFSAESSYFTIDPTTANVTLANDYDYDDASLAKEVNLTIRCSDGKGLFDDTIYSITIQDINDNTPICNPSVTSFSLTYAQVVNETLVNVDCTDADSTVNAELDYAPIGFTTGYASQYFQVDSVGNVSTYTDFLMDFNTSFYVTILITDRGTPSLSATVTLTVTYTERPTIVIYTKVGDTECFLCTTSAITLVAVASLLVFAIVLYLIVLGTLKTCYDCERRKIRRALTKKEKREWRWCGCLRPGELKSKKRKAREIQIAQMKDAEYMRARDALQGTDDPTLRIKEIIAPNPPKQLGNARRKGKLKARFDTPGTSTGTEGIEYMGRDKTPDLRATPVDSTRLTASQKEQLEKFKSLKLTSSERYTTKRTQAASDMVWTFQGRLK